MKTFLDLLPKINLTHEDIFENERIVASILIYILSKLKASRDEFSECAISNDTTIVLTPDELRAISDFLYLHMSIDIYSRIFKYRV